MASVHTMVTIQAFNGFEHGMVGVCARAAFRILLKGGAK